MTRADGSKKPRSYYDRKQIVDAPEHSGLSRAMGNLAWGTWDHDVRPVQERIEDFVKAFPPDEPTRYMSPGLARQSDGSFASAQEHSQLERFLSIDWRPGSLHELLARFGLKMGNGPPHKARPFVPEAVRTTAQRRNHRLRVLHGGVDIEPADMDVAKAELLDRQEKQRAAQDVREARKRMQEELDSKKKDT